MQQTKQGFSISSFRSNSSQSSQRNLFRSLVFWVAITLISGKADFAFAANEFDGFLNFVRVCTPELPPSRNNLSPQKEAEFKLVWAQVGVAGKKLESAWKNTLNDDPLMRRALKACDRYMQLEMQYNDLSRQLRAQYGAKKFRELESKWASWSKTQANEWINLKDRDLIRLAVWVLTYDSDQRWLQREPFSRFAKNRKRNEQDPFSQFVENVIRNQTGGLSRQDMLSQLILTQYETLSEQDAIEIYQAGVQWMRQQNQKQPPVPDIPELMQQYLKLRAEADYLFEVGDTYLRMTPRPEVETAKLEFTSLIKKAAALRPDLKEALSEAHQNQFRQD
ncbi:MAG: hypothetical protein ABIK07_09560 [Planctomycetota bacterium]